MNISWCNKFQYLGVMLVSGKSLNVDVDINRTKFLATAYAVLNRCGALYEEVNMQLITSQCVPILMHGKECFNLTAQQKARLTVALNCVVRGIYRLNRMISVKEYLLYN